MALIKCPECGHEISEFAPHCIFCGCPMDTIKGLLNKTICKHEIIQNKFISNLPKAEKEFVIKFTQSLNDKFIVSEYKNYLAFNSCSDEYKSFWLKRPKTGLKLGYKDDNGDKHTYAIVSTDPTYILRKIATNNTLKNNNKTYPKTNKNLESKQSFFSTLIDAEEKLINEFDVAIKESYANITSIEYSSMVAYKLEGKEYSIFWFTIEENQLVFKYRKLFDDRRLKNVVTVFAGNAGVKGLIRIVDELFKNNGLFPESKKYLLPINELIIKAMKGRSLIGKQNYIDIAKAVADFTTDWMYVKYKDQKRFSSREQFDKFKNGYSDYTYHGRSFSFKYISDSDATFMFKYYIASQLIAVIQRYERMFAATIITDYNTLINEYYKLIDEERDNYNSVNGINSNIKYVPLSSFEEVVNKYYYFKR